MKYSSNLLSTLLWVFALGLCSCQREESQDTLLVSHASDIVFRERSIPVPKLPKSYREKERLRALSANAPDFTQSPYNALGVVHSVGNGTIGHPMNIGNDGVFDVQSILKDKVTSKFLFNRDLDVTTTTLSIYHSIDSLREVTNRTRKVTSGFKLNLGLFSIGKERSYVNTFHSDISVENKHSWAEFDLLYYAKRIGLETTDAALKTVAHRNVSDQFLYSIYNYPISNFIREKGFLVVSDFYVGGRLSAKFDYSSSSNKRLQSTNKVVSDSIYGAFGWGVGKDQSVSAPLNAPKNVSLNIGYGRTNGSTNNQYSSNSRLFGVFQSIGGAKDKQVPSTITNLSKESINVGDWYASLGDERTHKYVDVSDGGLVSIDKFMLEANFRDRVDWTLSGKVPEKRTLDVPYVEIRNITSDLYNPRSPMAFEEADVNTAGVVLHTRQGDKVLFLNEDFRTRLSGHWGESDEEIRERYIRDTDKLVQRLAGIFDCEIKANRNSYLRILDRDELSRTRDLWMRFRFSFDSKKLYKYRNPKTGVWYIYDAETRSALSYYDSLDDDDDDTFVTDMYCITDWVNSLPERRISMQELSMYYNIIGL